MRRKLIAGLATLLALTTAGPLPERPMPDAQARSEGSTKSLTVDKAERLEHILDVYSIIGSSQGAGNDIEIGPFPRILEEEEPVTFEENLMDFYVVSEAEDTGFFLGNVEGRNAEIRDNSPREVLTDTPYDELTTANQFLRDFPTDLAGTTRVDKYETSGAATTIVHIRNLHYVSGLTEESQAIVEDFQTGVYNLLADLTERGDLVEIHAEGVTPDLERDFKFTPSLNEIVNGTGEDPCGCNEHDRKSFGDWQELRLILGLKSRREQIPW
ncbi:MAG: hypothetical protein ABH864_06190 [archaeon]